MLTVINIAPSVIYKQSINLFLWNINVYESF